MFQQIFENDVLVWSRLKRHRNILPLLGFAFDMDTGYPVLITEWKDNGNALDYINSKKLKSAQILKLVCMKKITQPQRLTCLLQVAGIAEGLSCLHDTNKIHSDIKPVS